MEKRHNKMNEYKIIGDITEIYIENYIVLIDTVNLKKVNKYKWHIHQNQYARHNIRPERGFMHHIITPIIKGMVIDHINRNKLDNRQSNLRVVNQKVNRRNSGLDNTNTTGVKGVYFYKRHNKWSSGIRIDNRLIHLGYFIDKEYAIKSRKEAELKYWGTNY